MDLGAYWTPHLNTLKPLFVLLFELIFPVSKAEVARSNRAGQTKNFKNIDNYVLDSTKVPTISNNCN